MAGRRDPDLLHRWEGNPILTIKDIPFRCNTVFNGSPIKVNGEYLILLRVEGQQGELRRVGRDTEIAGQCQLAAATQGVAVDRRDRGPWKSLHRREERRVDRRQSLVSGSLAQLVDVRPRHERLVAGPGQD